MNTPAMIRSEILDYPTTVSCMTSRPGLTSGLRFPVDTPRTLVLQALVTHPYQTDLLGRHAAWRWGMVTLRGLLLITFVFVAALLLAVPDARGQVTTATLYGLVRDTSGAVLPGVNVTV